MRSLYAEGAPPMLRMAALVQILEAVGFVAIAVAQVVEVASGQSYQASNGLALAVFEVVVAVILALIARGMAQLRPWSRTPGVMTQIGVGLLGIILLQASRPEIGIPALVLAVAGLVGLFHPASLRALRRHFGDAQDTPDTPATTEQRATAKTVKGNSPAKAGSAAKGSTTAKAGTTAKGSSPAKGSSAAKGDGAAKGNSTAKGDGAAKASTAKPRSSSRRR